MVSGSNVYESLSGIEVNTEDFLQKLKKVVRIVLYGLAISQSDCRKSGPYQLPSNNAKYFLVRNLY